MGLGVQGKRALVTGSSAGIGAAIAEGVSVVRTSVLPARVVCFWQYF
jgi:NAD(P)-dependent dehydrogenase (short-subunit alcohol dehydrogenase family)